MLSIICQRSLKHALRNTLKARRLMGGTGLAEHYYFAYGANLSSKRLSLNHMTFDKVGLAKLPGYSLKFNVPCEYLGRGYASIAASDADQSVWGMLYRLDSLSLALMDILEWVPFGFYTRREVSVSTPNGTTVSAWAYFADRPRDGLKPTSAYLNFMLSSMSDENFPVEYIEKLRGVPSSDESILDPEFSLLSSHLRRPFMSKLRPLYLRHDRLREALARRLP